VRGAAGRVGSRLVKEALGRGHVVTGVLRRPSQRADLPGGAIPVIADVSDADQVAAFAAHQDVVIDATRPVPDDPDQTAATTRGILRGLRSAGARLLVSGGAAVLEAPDTTRRVLDDPKLLPPPYQAIGQASALQHRIVAAETEVDWAYLCPPLQLEPGRRTGRYVRGAHTLLKDADGSSAISMEDLAVALMDEAERPRVHRDHFTVVAAPA